VATSFDSRWTVYTIMSLWERGDANLDEYGQVLAQNDFYGVICVGAQPSNQADPTVCRGHWYGVYPVGIAVVAMPLVLGIIGVLHLAAPMLAGIQAGDPVIAGFLRGDWDRAHPLIEMEAASFFLALSAVLMYWIALRYLTQRKAILLAILFATATPAYSVAGRALWGHTPALLCVSAGIYLLLAAEDHPQLAGWAGLPAAIAYTVRPTSALFVVMCAAYVWHRHRAYLWRFLAAAAPALALFVAYNLATYHSPLSPYYQIQPGSGQSAYLRLLTEALAGNLISPARGLLLYTPIFGVAIWSVLRRRWVTPLAPWLAGLALMHWIAISTYVQFWWAGHSFGPRYFTELTSVFVVLSIPVLQRWDGYGFARRAVLVALVVVSLGVHLRGGWSGAVYRWNTEPVNIDAHPERNWDWSDPPFLRGPLIGCRAPGNTGQNA